MYILMTNVLDSHIIKKLYLQVDDDFLTVIKWTDDLSKAKVFDTTLAAELFVSNNAEYLNRNLDSDNIFVAELVPNMRYYLGNFGKNRVGSDSWFIHNCIL